jgi:hypothetical protein
MGARKALGELLVRERLIDIDQLEQARRDQKVNACKIRIYPRTSIGRSFRKSLWASGN